MNAKDDYQKRMARKKNHIDKRIQEANINKAIIVLLTGNGKGKSSSAFGMVCRALGYKKQVGVVQFIKGAIDTGESLFFKTQPLISYFAMHTGFTWDTQNKEADSIAANKTWQNAKKLLNNPNIELVVLDELTYMLNYKYLDAKEVLTTIKNRPINQHLVITGRAADKVLINIADTVSDVKNIKHAFDENIAAQKCIDY